MLSQDRSELPARYPRERYPRPWKLLAGVSILPLYCVMYMSVLRQPQTEFCAPGRAAPGPAAHGCDSLAGPVARARARRRPAFAMHEARRAGSTTSEHSERPAFYCWLLVLRFVAIASMFDFSGHTVGMLS